MDICYKAFKRILSLAEKPFHHKILFFHIAKCGGTSVSNAIGRLFGNFSESQITRLDSRAALKSAQVFNESYFEFTEKLLMYEMGKENMKYITGHFLFCPSVYGEFSDRWDFITILRHPVSRWFSQYFYNFYKTGDHFKTDLDIQSYMESKEGIDSGRTLIATLAFYDYVESEPRKSTTEAINNLHKFAIVGCLERLDTFVRKFEEQYRSKLLIPQLNKSPISLELQKDLITDAILNKVKEICRYDLEVYDYALSHFT